ncbi:alpha/beta hydrolase [Streptomyces sp. NPDC091290]|uniref:alpha/beta hydrolase n=1 Tax=Streptomyces sp. NPDC091290 TaxID=3365990 RepID=UPI00380DB913
MDRFLPSTSSALDDFATGAWDTVLLPSPGHEVPVRVYRPREARGWLVWAHGGSWRSGSSLEWQGACTDLARIARCTVVNVEYRLLPHRHPAALHDVVTALEWAQEQATREGDGQRLAIGGDSAGGTLAACAALLWRDRKLPLAAQVLAYPPLDPSCAAGSYRPDGRFPTQSGMVAAWQNYRGEGTPVHQGQMRLHSTPFDEEDLAGVPPAILAVGELDPVVDDVRRYARLLRAAGTEVDLRILAETPHGVFCAGTPGWAVHGRQGHVLRHYLGDTLRRRFREPRIESVETSPQEPS